MKILVSSSKFWPEVGGIEVVGQLLCREFVRFGHTVRVLTDSAGPTEVDGYEIVRNPSSGDLVNGVRWADVVFHNNISLRHAWPLLFFPRPWVVTVHTWIARIDGSRGMRDRIKLNALSTAHTIAISQCVAASLPVSSVQIFEPYDSEVFNSGASPSRHGILSVGRLVSDKGFDLLIEAMANLCRRDSNATLTIVGDGPERRSLEALARRRGLAARITFVGALTGKPLADQYRRHKVLAVPSRWREPFGIVAVEGIACGCVVVGAGDCGLEDAIGSCGILFKRGDAEDLAEKLNVALHETGSTDSAIVDRHLSRLRPAAVAKRYLEVFQSAMAAQGRVCAS